MALLGGVALLEEVCHCGGRLCGLYGSSFPQGDGQMTPCCLQDVLFSAPAPSLPAYCYALCHDGNGWNHWNCKQPSQLNIFLNSCPDYGISSLHRKPQMSHCGQHNFLSWDPGFSQKGKLIWVWAFMYLFFLTTKGSCCPVLSMWNITSDGKPKKNLSFHKWLLVSILSQPEET